MEHRKWRNAINFPSSGLSILQPVPTQLLTLTEGHGNPIHIELDNGAMVNYITLNEARAQNFYISPNKQLSKLGDGDTMLHACREINTTLFRDDNPLTFKALVCKKLHSPVIGGTFFIRDNGIKQDFVNNTISTLNDRRIIPATTREAILPINPHHNNLP